MKEIQETITICEKNGDYAYGEHFVSKRLWYISTPWISPESQRSASPSRSLFVFLKQFANGISLLGSAKTALGNYDCALEHLMKVKDEMDRQPLMNDWFNSMPLQAGITELWLRKGDLPQARREAERFLDVSPATAERTYQGLAWEANARVAIAGGEWTCAEECIAKGLSTIEGYEVPMAAWRLHGTAAELCARAGNIDLAEHHCELSRATIMKLANSLEAEDPLRATFLSAQPVRKVLDYSA